MLCGLLVIHPGRVQEGWLESLYSERQVLGSVMGSLEGWLGLRSVRTLQLRVMHQSRTATGLVEWLTGQLSQHNSIVDRAVEKVMHASLQTKALKDGWLQKQMPKGFGAVFAIVMKDANYAQRLPTCMFCFQHATSLGGVESLMEWRAMSDKDCDRRLVRVSVGLEDIEDLKNDLLQGMKALLGEFPLVGYTRP